MGGGGIYCGESQVEVKMPLKKKKNFLISSGGLSCSEQDKMVGHAHCCLFF